MPSRPLNGTTVISFESRLADETARLIEKQGGRSISAPSMKEAPLESHHDVFAFGERLFDGAVDVLVLLTGVGTRMLIETLATRHSSEAIVDRLHRTILLARGPKPVRVLRSFGLEADMKVPEPNTWRELMALVDAADSLQPLPGKRFEIQEYGVPNEELTRALLERGVKVRQVPIYRWELPDDLDPMHRAFEALIGRTAQVVLFTSRTQIDHVMELAKREGVADELREALAETFVGSIGPICSEGLRSYGIEPDMEPEHPKLGVLVRDAATRYGSSITA